MIRRFTIVQVACLLVIMAISRCTTGGQSGEPTVAVPSPTVSLVPGVSPPRLDSPSLAPFTARFRLVVSGFLCVDETEDHLLEADGKRDEVQLVAHVSEADLVSTTTAYKKIQSLEFGDTNHHPQRIKAGEASDLGGIGTGNMVGSRTRDAEATADRLPLLLWEGDLAAGRKRVLIALMIWEMDDTPEDTLVEPRWETGLNGLAVGTVTGVLDDPSKLIQSLPDLTIRRDWPGLGGRAGHRPIRLVPEPIGAITPDFQIVIPKVIVLTYETALLASQTGRPDPGLKGTEFVQYTDLFNTAPVPRQIDGDYQIFVHLERLAPST